MEYNVKIDAFEGPLDLLLHLINSLEIDIYDIPMAQITEQYMLYVHTMKDLQLDVASEYLVMAATLLAIKSKMLLPKHDEGMMGDEIEFEEEDPRDELVERLIEYRKFKEAANELKHREEERGQVYTKPPSDLSEFSEEVDLKNTEVQVSLYDMLGAFHKLLRRKKLQRPVQTRITRQEISIEKRMTDILENLQNLKRRTSFTSLFPSDSKEHLVVTFLAVLELMKRKQIIVNQENNFTEIFVEAGKEAGMVEQY
ncbi:MULTISPECIES: segregation/condensation protein A [Rossellomorea]|uniref:Segregation and condensation protein A n=1 Tax=Rossellomorea vietnamensis TaxID=218284 RepID=A0A6I6URM0_9BACI|nr:MULTISPECIES: segregation/condensation protein A [Rossellomorea]MCA0147754.1 segregation/condensation protein A [Rossellomorea vietnamensis]QHE62051.1 segregation/condensation protein A [Rossellomorea vietnamensis]UTE76204.1 segregation/condensation protein A [Rossellomorea sp. KS-H15a]WGG44045.1 segregation/condensation protein A [Rossellomorea sp. DA94]